MLVPRDKWLLPWMQQMHVGLVEWQPEEVHDTMDWPNLPDTLLLHTKVKWECTVVCNNQIWLLATQALNENDNANSKPALAEQFKHWMELQQWQWWKVKQQNNTLVGNLQKGADRWNFHCAVFLWEYTQYSSVRNTFTAASYFEVG